MPLSKILEAYAWIEVFDIRLRVYDVEIATVDFCGFANVHRGFKEKLMAMLESTLAEFGMWEVLQHGAGTFSQNWLRWRVAEP